LNLLIEYNVGQDRCGVQFASSVVKLAKEINSSPYLHFRGIHAYNGRNQHVRKYKDRKEAVELVVSKVRELVRVLEDEKLKPEVVTGGGTGTYLFEATSKVYTEIQPGSYLFMDADYGNNLNEEGKQVVIGDHSHDLFRQSLFVLSTVISKPETGDRVIVDSGLKAGMEYLKY
jgi:D-serine deaminase-like pyridoxal phosphate-dependent protein